MMKGRRRYIDEEEMVVGEKQTYHG